MRRPGQIEGTAPIPRAYTGEISAARRSAHEAAHGGPGGQSQCGQIHDFQRLTGLHQHTGNWPGKTVALAEGSLRAGDCSVHLVDLPGTYSLTAGSPEEEVARDYLLSGVADVTLAVADATCLCRNLNLILQIRQITSRLVVCVNLLDEAEKDGLEIDLAALSRLLSCPVVGAAAGRGRGLAELMRAIIAQAEYTAPPGAWRVPYPAPVEKALALLPCPRYRALALLCGELAPQPEETAALSRALDSLGGLTGRDLRDAVTAARVQLAEEMGASCLRFKSRPTGGTGCWTGCWRGGLWVFPPCCCFWVQCFT